MKNASKPYKAVGLLSGGLDSTIATKLLLDQGIKVHAMNISMPWGCGRPSRVIALAAQFGIPFKSFPLGDDYLPVLTKPKYGFGSAHNPCVDCHIYMVRKAAAYMKEIGASFVFTGEVLGQRPMSQRRECLGWVEHDAGIPGQLLRPMSAKLLPPTIAEQEGIVDREKLLDISGRSRKRQFALAKELGLGGYSSPGGGCLLTEKLFGERLEDVLKRGCDNIAATAVLGLGRYFRIDDTAFVILGRDNAENEKLVRYAVPGDVILRPTVFPGPAALLRGGTIDEARLAFVAGLSQFHSKSRDKAPQPLQCWHAQEPDKVSQVTAAVLTQADVDKLQL